MSNVIPFSTEKAALAVFDPEVLQGRVRESADWWHRQPQHVVEEVAEGQIGVFPIGRHGSYRTALRVGEGPNEAEQPYVVAAAEGHGLSVVSGRVFVGAVERLPGDGMGQIISQIPDTGELLEVPEGNYAIVVHVLHWRDEDAFYDEDNEVLGHAPPDYLVELRPVEARLQVRSSPPPLRDLIPKAERKGQAKIAFQPRRKRSLSTAPVAVGRGRRRRVSIDPEVVGTGSGPPKPPRHVPVEVAAYHYDTVVAAFKEVVDGNTLAPPAELPVQRLIFQPRDKNLAAHEVEVDVLLKKITRLREQARMLEGKVNGNKNLSRYDTAGLQEPVTLLQQALDEMLCHVSRNAVFEPKEPPPSLPSDPPPPPRPPQPRLTLD